ncbi:hypothetical protein [Longimicrobium sp.]|uniref:hypothetical protein n=1 Tax=Longimicrobium sp. TaxID=2029185 RepID=UPI002E340615|nr:hypothetical protein [Longimicrobium sp.]HEX6042408.1 hypothetical protein [Longimicrobium sp.]
MKHFPRLGAAMFAVVLATAACSGNNRNPVYYPGSARPTVDRNGDGRIDSRDREGNRDRSARPNGNKGKRDEVRCNAGNGNGNGNGRCRNGNRGRGNGRGE